MLSLKVTSCYIGFMESGDAKKLGSNLKKIRTEKGMSQVDIAKELGVNRGFVSSIESGKRNPTLSTITRIAAALGVETSQLLE